MRTAAYLRTVHPAEIPSWLSYQDVLGFIIMETTGPDDRARRQGQTTGSDDTARTSAAFNSFCFE